MPDSTGYTYIQKISRKKYLELQKSMEREFAKIADEFDAKIQRLVFQYRRGDGLFDTARKHDIDREVEAITSWLTEQNSRWIDKNLVHSADIAIKSQDAAARHYIKSAINDYKGTARDQLIKAASDPKAPFLLRTQFGTGLPEYIRKQVWSHRWADGHSLSDRIWTMDGMMKRNLHGMVEQCINEGRSAVEFSRAVEQYLEKPGPAWTTAIKPSITGRGSIKYNALRLARTETNQAYQRAQKLSAKESILVKGMKWNLSASHPIDWPPSAAYMGYPEICDFYAEHDHVGLGPGVFYVDAVPWDHPNGLCYLTDVLKTGRELIEALEEKYDVKIPVEEIKESSLAEVIRAKENEIKGRNIEEGYVFDDDGSIVWHKTGDHDSIRFSAEEAMHWKDKVFTHNHPRGTSFSLADVNVAINFDLKEIRAVGEQFRYSIKRPAEGWPERRLVLEEAARTSQEVRQILERKVIAGEITPEQASFTHYHMVWEFMKARYGLDYSREGW